MTLFLKVSRVVQRHCSLHIASIALPHVSHISAPVQSNGGCGSPRKISPSGWKTGAGRLRSIFTQVLKARRSISQGTAGLLFMILTRLASGREDARAGWVFPALRRNSNADRGYTPPYHSTTASISSIRFSPALSGKRCCNFVLDLWRFAARLMSHRDIFLFIGYVIVAVIVGLTFPGGVLNVEDNGAWLLAGLVSCWIAFCMR